MFPISIVNSVSVFLLGGKSGSIIEHRFAIVLKLVLAPQHARDVKIIFSTMYICQ